MFPILSSNPDTSTPVSEAVASTTASEGVDSTTEAVAAEVAEVAPEATDPFVELGYGIPTDYEELWTITKFVHKSLGIIQETSGLPWWAVIALCTVTFRTALFPLSVEMAKSTTALASVREPLEVLNNELEAHKKANGGTVDKEFRLVHAQKSGELMKTAGFKGWSMGTPLLQAPVFMSFFFGLRSIHLSHDVSQGGIGWFPNLGAFDPYFVLPVLNCLFSLASIEFGSSGAKTAQSQNVKNFMRILFVCLCPILAKFPAGVLLYWTTNSLCTTVQGVILRNETVKKALGIPILSEADQKGKPSNAEVAAQKAAMSPLELNKKMQDKARIKAMLNSPEGMDDAIAASKDSAAEDAEKPKAGKGQKRKEGSSSPQRSRKRRRR